MDSVKKIVFITGTDTGVGKTVLTGLLLAFLRGEGCRALAMKPFCSGGRGDARLLQAMQRDCLTIDDVNPFYFDKPVAPGAPRAGRAPVPLRTALREIEAVARRCDLLLVEGIGGLLAPLGRSYDARDLIKNLNCKTIVVSPNRLGTINHTLLTVGALQAVCIKEVTIAMMGVKKPDESSVSNPKMVWERLRGVPLVSVPFLGPGACGKEKIKKSVIFLKKTLARLAGGDTLHPFFAEQKRLIDETC